MTFSRLIPLILVTLATFASAADEDASKAPLVLSTNAQYILKSLDRKIVEERQKMNKAYFDAVTALEKEKVSITKNGDLEGAMAIQGKIKELNALIIDPMSDAVRAMVASVDSNDLKNRIIGTWKEVGIGTVTIDENLNVTHSNGNHGTIKVNAANTAFDITFKNGYKNTDMKYDRNKNSFTGSVISPGGKNIGLTTFVK